MIAAETPWKFVLLGGDGKTAANYLAAAALAGHRLDHFASMHELGYLGRFREYDAAIVHDDMQPLSGLELAEYLEKLFQSLPMILLTQECVPEFQRKLLPASVVESFPVSQEAQLVLDRVTQALHTKNLIAPLLAAVERR